MYSITIQDFMMVAHTLPDSFFGPAQRLHGLTYVVEAEFSRGELDRHNVVIEAEKAAHVLKEVLNQLNFRNLDEIESLRDRLTTTEFLAWHLHQEISRRLSHEFQGTLKVTLHESPRVWGSYEGNVG